MSSTSAAAADSARIAPEATVNRHPLVSSRGHVYDSIEEPYKPGDTRAVMIDQLHRLAARPLETT